MTGSGIQAVLEELCAEVPALQPLWAEHLNENYGELLPHVFLADVARFAVASLQGPPDQATVAQSIVMFLERAFAAGDPDVQELIGVSFIENLPRDEEPGHEIRRLLGPHLLAEAKRST